MDKHIPDRKQNENTERKAQQMNHETEKRNTKRNTKQSSNHN